MITMELEAFIANATLPEGVHFCDFGDAVTVMPVLDGPTGTYLTTKFVRLLKNEKYADIVLSRSTLLDPRGMTVNVVKLCAEIEKAIEGLS